MIRLDRIWKLYACYSLVLIAGVTVIGFALEKQITSRLEAHIKEDAVTLARVVSESLPATDDSAILDAFCRKYHRLAGLRLTLIRKDGKVMGESERESAEMENHLDRAEVQEAIRGRIGTSVRESDTQQREMLYVALPLEKHGKILRAAMPMASVKTFQNELMAFFSVGLYLMPVLILVAAFLFGKHRIREASSSPR